MKKWVYSFDEGDKSQKLLLGGKGANLCEMTKLGLPVPFGFVLTTEVCEYYNQNGRSYPEELSSQLETYLKKLEEKMERRFGDSSNPLLVSVRSGAAASMPGMMDTVLNLGLNDQIVEGWIKTTGNARLCYDAYRRFLQMFGDVVLELPHEDFNNALDSLKAKNGLQLDIEMTDDHLKELIVQYKAVYEKHGKKVPQDPMEQLWKAIEAVFKSWDNPRAIKYRELNDIRGLIGTAVNVQSMVFGNMNDQSATGVAFTRNPSTGEHKFFGEYLVNAQGEDVVAGIRTPNDISEMKNTFPEVYDELDRLQKLLEKNYRDMQDIEFTIQEGKLYLLQTRNGKRTAESAVRIAVEMEKEGVITKEEALMRIEPKQLDQLLHPRFDPKKEKEAQVIAKGLPASPGAATGKIVFTADVAVDWTHKGEQVILVRLETSPEDIEGMHVSAGILTARGGMTSHAAVVARGMGTCCVSGASNIQIDEKKRTLKIGDNSLKEGDFISLNGSTGEVFLGSLDMIEPELSGNFGTLMSWADEVRELRVRTNADTPHDAKVAFDFGAEGIGLCRTEHMFFQEERIKYMRMMILADNPEDREKSLEKIIPFQRGDFEDLFRAMQGHPVIIRTLDPPLHEFLPHKDEEIEIIAKEMNISMETVHNRIKQLHEFNPMLGHRGCRLGITMPEITKMQATALVEAAYNVQSEGVKVQAEIMVPLVGKVEELQNQKEIIKGVIDDIKAQKGGKDAGILIGTMIEVPRAAVTADEIAKEADFFSFGTNDLTQMSCGLSRDDSGNFLQSYIAKGIYEYDPFQSIDQSGVGELIRIAVEKGRKTKPQLEIGICGEHGGDPESIKFCHKMGLNYVSCSPYRVPIARLSAAQAVIEGKKEGVKIALSIAGSDPCSGAGLQADLKTFHSHQVYGCTAVTAVTVQNTQKVYSLHKVPAKQIFDQVNRILEDIPVSVIKIGLIAGGDSVDAIADILQLYPQIPVVIDPVLRSSSGYSLLPEEFLPRYMERLFPLTYLLTPNLMEAAEFTGLQVRNLSEMEKAIEKLVELGADKVILKGGHLDDSATDLAFDGNEFRSFPARKIQGEIPHGTGCVLASAVAVNIALGYDFFSAVGKAKEYMTKAISNAIPIGKGQTIIRHF